MRRHARKISRKAGLPPGTLVHIGEEKAERTRITVLDYDELSFRVKEVETIDECLPSRDEPTVRWINVDGLHQVEVLERVGDAFELHPLVLEDILNTGQRPKVEDFGNYVYIVLKMFCSNDTKDEIVEEQISLILGPAFVISFQERPGDVFEPLTERIKSDRGPIRKMGADYLAYALLDSVVDSYFVILEKLGERMEFLEEELVTNPRTETLQVIHNLKREIAFLRKSLWPLREIVSRLERGESALILESTQLYLRDVYDHIIQVIDTVETLRDMLSGMLDIYLSSVSNRMNEVMKVLTMIATIFIPLTLIVGIYGMNFQHMPELQWRWGYPLVWLIMLAIGTSMLVYFRRKRWL